MTGLVAFVTARLDEDEAIARAVRDKSAPEDGRWQARYGYLETAMCEVLIPVPPDDMPLGLVAHLARHDPARVLRDVAADRAILTECSFALADPVVDHDDTGPGLAGEMLRHMAARWSDHPDYAAAVAV